MDIWPVAMESYQRNHPHQAVCADIRTMTPDQLEARYGIRRGEVDVVVGGPPCQSFSMAGQRRKDDPRNTLFMEYVRYLEYYQPRAFLMENVMGILSKTTETGEKVMDIILRELVRVGYHCRVNKLWASDFEVPQNRRRVIVAGIRRDLGRGEPPAIPLVIPTVAQRLPVGPLLLPREAVGAEFFLSPRALEGIRRKREKSREKGRGFNAQFLDVGKPSYTILSRYWKDGYDALVRYSDTEIRRLTVLELRRIQTFPDDYDLAGGKKDVVIQIGNAVPCRLAYHLGRWLQQVLADKKN
jgi:DNA (cytosine-5)-methyltransferase 1